MASFTRLAVLVAAACVISVTHAQIAFPNDIPSNALALKTDTIPAGGSS
jgi:hypothetical protein